LETPSRRPISLADADGLHLEAVDRSHVGVALSGQLGVQLVDERPEAGDEEIEEFLTAGYTRRNALEVVLGIGTYTMSTLANRLVRA
jgi:hypothetical protein